MGKVLIQGGGGAGESSADLTAIHSMVLNGYTYVGQDTDDESGTGTMPFNESVTRELSAGNASTAPDSYIIPIGYHDGTGVVKARSLSAQTSATAAASEIWSGKTAWVNGVKLTGSLAVSPATNFRVSQYANKTVTATWERPESGSNWSGIIVRYRTDRFPSSISDGTELYKGTSNNVTKDVNITYSKGQATIYIRAWSYLTTSKGTLYSTAMDAKVVMSEVKGSKSFSSGATWVVPSLVYSVEVFCVGGGGGAGGYSNVHVDDYGCGGAGGGYTTRKTISVTPGESLAIIIGAGGAGGGKAGNTEEVSRESGGDGGTSGVMRGNTWLASANGGKGSVVDRSAGANGGSGGGAARVRWSSLVGGSYGGTGGSNGSDGQSGSTQANYGGTGQGTTTKDWDGTVYAGGGGGYGSLQAGAGGEGGGAAASLRGGVRSNGTNGTGGGGGAGGCSSSSSYPGGNGGSGIVLVRWGY